MSLEVFSIFFTDMSCASAAKQQARTKCFGQPISVQKYQLKNSDGEIIFIWGQTHWTIISARESNMMFQLFLSVLTISYGVLLFV